VTGSSRGIGAAITRRFLDEGAIVVGISRSTSTESQTAAASGFTAMNVDLAKAAADSLSLLVESIVAKHGRIDVLVNNAGIIRRAPALEYGQGESRDWEEVLHLNLTVPFFLMQAVARWWVRNRLADDERRLRIVNIASLLSFQGGILVPAYAASKHGIAGLTKALANEWASLGINVNAVAPGYVETENTAALRADANRSAAILARIPQGAWAKPDDIAGACLFLASSDADYVNGTILNVDGGWLGR
jgi:2-deoxy-D-gluconate 3-dehydrogenase